MAFDTRLTAVSSMAVELITAEGHFASILLAHESTSPPMHLTAAGAATASAKPKTTTLENASVLENVSADILGHEKPTMTYGVYSGGASLAQKRESIEKLAYPQG